MLDGEVYVLQAVRDTLRTKLNLTELQCNVEPDEQVPAIAGDIYVAVMPGSVQPGPNHNTSGGVVDTLQSVKVTVFRRCGAIARDRVRDVILDQMKGVNSLLSQVCYAIDWQIDVMTLSNHLLHNDFPNSKPFIEMLRVTNLEVSTRGVNSETYAAASKGSFVARARSVTFGGCRRIQYVNQAN